MEAINGINLQSHDRSKDRSKSGKAFKVSAVRMMFGDQQGFFLNDLDVGLVELDQVQFRLQQALPGFRQPEGFQVLPAGFTEEVGEFRDRDMVIAQEAMNSVLEAGIYAHQPDTPAPEPLLIARLGRRDKDGRD